MNDAFFMARSWRQAKVILRHPKFFRGFQEACAGRSFDYRAADGWTEMDQHRYENGREIGAECRAVGIAVRWREPARIPPELKAVVRARIHGHAPTPYPRRARGPVPA